jgi:ferredoxin
MTLLTSYITFLLHEADPDIEGYVLLLSAAPGEELFAREDIREAVANCPSRALSWRTRASK